jgi:TRAP transporter TAXI family solute receptor
MTISRRSVLAAALFAGGSVASGGLAGCASDTASAKSDLWHNGRLFIATGNTTGVFYQLGGGLADLITNYVPGYEARAEPTNASAENTQRVSSGDFDIAFVNGDTAADAAGGKASFEGKPQRIVALARIYRNYVHCIVRTNAKITKFADLKGKRVSTGSAGSGTDILAGRILQAGGLNPDTDITRQRISLPETAKGMAAGTTDALFFTGGLPTPGITDLMSAGPTQYTFLALDPQLPPLTQKYGSVYGVAKLAKATYNLPDDVQTIVLFNMLIASPDMPDQLAHDITKALFEHQPELAKVHPEGGNFDKGSAPNTDPVPLHPGARAYYETG